MMEGRVGAAAMLPPRRGRRVPGVWSLYGREATQLSTRPNSQDARVASRGVPFHLSPARRTGEGEERATGERGREEAAKLRSPPSRGRSQKGNQLHTPGMVKGWGRQRRPNWKDWAAAPCHGRRESLR